MEKESGPPEYKRVEEEEEYILFDVPCLPDRVKGISCFILDNTDNGVE